MKEKEKDRIRRCIGCDKMLRPQNHSGICYSCNNQHKYRMFIQKIKENAINENKIKAKGKANRISS